MSLVKDKKFLIGISGGIAAFKTASLVSHLRKSGAQVKVIMTESAQRFITPLTFQTLSGNRVYTDLFGAENANEIDHIALTDWCDYFIIAPATANIIGKITSGIADDLLSTTVMTIRVPSLIVPAMNTRMWENKIVQKNVAILKEMGFIVMEPATGQLACGHVGKGRLPEPMEIFNFLIKELLEFKEVIHGDKETLD